MYEEVRAQPEALRRALDEGQSAADTVEGLFEGRRRVYVTGCGTSFHAAVVAEYWLRALSLFPDARAVEAFELTTGPYAFDESSLVIAFSQSGGKGATVRAVQKARSAGAATLAVTGHADSALAAEADTVLSSGFADEVSWAHTISYTSSLAAFLSSLPTGKGGSARPGLAEQLARLPDAVSAFLRDADDMRGLAAALRDLRRIFLIGTGANWGTALEGSLKLRETCYLQADALNAEYFLHGPISSLDESSLLIALAPPDATRERTLAVLRAARTIGATTLTVGQIGDSELEDASDHFIEMPPVAEELTPLLYVLPVQMLAYWLSVENGVNPDLIRRDQEPYLKAREGYGL